MKRRRSSKFFPAHIIPEKLPDNVWYDKSGAGKWMIQFKDDATKKWRSKRLCSGKSTLSEIWQAFEAQKTFIVITFTSISLEFQKTITWRKLAVSTQNDYLDCHKSIVSRKVTDGILGDVPIIKWTVGLVRRYRDARGEESQSRANKELSYIKRIFSWAYEYEKIKFNPTLGIKKLSIKPRQHYAEDEDYQFMLDVARESNYWYAPAAMELAYLCRMRLCEVLDLTDANELSDGLLIKRRKGSRNNITEWSPRLRAAWDDSIKKRNEILSKRKQPYPIRPEDRFIFISERTGDKIQTSSLKTAISRINHQSEIKAKEQGIDFVHFTFHDLKRKGVSDTEGDKQKASGHKNARMLQIYDVKVEKVRPAGENKTQENL
jgi:site-specific recombinase XerD